MTLSLIPSLVTLERPSGKDGRLVIWMPCNLGGSNPVLGNIFVMFTYSVFLSVGLAAFNLANEIKHDIHPR